MARELGEYIDLSQTRYQRDAVLGEEFTSQVLLAFNVSNTEAPSVQPYVVFDLTNYEIYGEQTPYTDEIRNFLRRRGIRFKPIHWRYRGGAKEFKT